jgi:large subunit ribosomal protein L5
MAGAKEKKTKVVKEKAVKQKEVKLEGKEKVKAGPAPKETYPPRLKEKYRQTVVPALMKQFAYANPMQVPRLEKVVLNVGMGKAIQNAKLLESAVNEMTLITGQKPVVTRAKKSISTFKLRQGMAIGCKVTLRGERMYEFLDRFFNVALPRIRDFKGVSPKSFDGRGNYSMGLKEQLLFPELKYDEVSTTHGMDVTIATTARSNDEGKALLGLLGMPFRT